MKNITTLCRSYKAYLYTNHTLKRYYIAGHTGIILTLGAGSPWHVVDAFCRNKCNARDRFYRGSAAINMSLLGRATYGFPKRHHQRKHVLLAPGPIMKSDVFGLLRSSAQVYRCLLSCGVNKPSCGVNRCRKNKVYDAPSILPLPRPLQPGDQPFLFRVCLFQGIRTIAEALERSERVRHVYVHAGGKASVPQMVHKCDTKARFCQIVTKLHADPSYSSSSSRSFSLSWTRALSRKQKLTSLSTHEYGGRGCNYVAGCTIESQNIYQPWKLTLRSSTIATDPLLINHCN